MTAETDENNTIMYPREKMTNHTRRQINLYRMFFADFSVNSQTDFHDILYGLFASHSATTVIFSLENIV